MEAFMAVNVFSRSLARNVAYTPYWGDGDLATEKILRNRVGPMYARRGFILRKYECASHRVRNFDNQVNNVVKDSKGVTNVQKKAMETSIFTTLRDRLNETLRTNEGGDIAMLQDGFTTAVFHFFGNHSRCDNADCPDAPNIRLKVSEAAFKTITYKLRITLLAHCRTLIHNINTSVSESFNAIPAMLSRHKGKNNLVLLKISLLIFIYFLMSLRWVSPGIDRLINQFVLLYYRSHIFTHYFTL